MTGNSFAQDVAVAGLADRVAEGGARISRGFQTRAPTCSSLPSRANSGMSAYVDIVCLSAFADICRMSTNADRR